MDEEIEDFLQSQKKLLEDTRTYSKDKISQRSQELENKYNKHMEDLKRELETKRLEIIEEGEAKATTIRLNVSDKEIESIVMKALNKYLEES